MAASSPDSGSTRLVPPPRLGGMTEEFISDYAQFISASPSSFHAAQTIADRLVRAGFARQEEGGKWAGHRLGFVVRGGAVIAWQIGDVTAKSGFRIVGSHTDSPSFKVKPSPGSEAYGFGQVNVEVYGGSLLNSWLNRDLGIAGVVTDRAGTAHLVRTGPLMVIPQVAPHLDRSVNTRLELSKQTDYKPVWSIGEADLFSLLAERAGISAEDVAGHDLYAYDVQAPAVFGGDGGGVFLAAGRQDNLSSVYASLHAFLATARAAAVETGTVGASAVDTSPVASGSGRPDIAVFAAFDHEEVGSSTYSGAAGPFLETTLRRIAEHLASTGLAGRQPSGTELAGTLDGGAAPSGYELFARMLANSSMLSADAGHSVNPNQPGKHDPDHRPTLGAGPLLKVNANQRYASDAQGAAILRRAADYHGVPTQDFASHNDVPCGSTIGPLTASRLGIRTVDVGIPLLSMHSVREISQPADITALAQICEGYWLGA